MLGLVLKVAGVATAAGFAAGVYSHRKAGKASEAIKEKFSKMETHTVQVHVPKGTNLDDCQLRVLVPIEDDD
jgi:hypothetical protein